MPEPISVSFNAIMWSKLVNGDYDFPGYRSLIKQSCKVALNLVLSADSERLVEANLMSSDSCI